MSVPARAQPEPAVREIENLWIPLSDGARLSAHLWLPPRAETEPVPAVVEVSPYRHEDNTRRRDAVRHPYFAQHGYASLRVDVRGSGASDGVLLDEYSEREIGRASCRERVWIWVLVGYVEKSGEVGRSGVRCCIGKACPG